MKLMNHPSILRIYDVYESPKELFLVLEYVEGGELFDYLVNRGKLSEPETICFFKQIIYGLNYAHTFSIIHRDLKPENILISSLSPPRIKILSLLTSLQLETSCGSPHYASPEIVNGHKYTGNATDIWSCGVILYALLTGSLPFDDKDIKVLLEKVKVGKYEIPQFIDSSARDLLSRMLVVNADERITIPDILAHPWLNTSVAARRHRSQDPSLQPVLPPSPDALACPIADPHSFDDEILQQLSVIWGRVHTKAFYWLLRRHNEEVDRLSGKDDGSGHGMGPGSVTFNLAWELDTSGLGDARRDRQSAHALLPPLMTRNPTSSSTASSSRSRPSSPGGPRLPNVPRPTYERAASEFSDTKVSRPRYERTSTQLSYSTHRTASGRSSSQPKSSFVMGTRTGSVLNGGHGGPRNSYSQTRSGQSSSQAPAILSRSDSSSGARVSTVQFPPAHPVQNTQSHHPVPRPSRARAATTAADTSLEEEKRVLARPTLQARPHSQQTSQIPTYGLAPSSVRSGTDSSSGSSTACSITSTATRAVSSRREVLKDIDDKTTTSSPSPPPLLPPLPPLPLLTAPKMADPVLQVELDDIAEHVNRLSLRNLDGNTPAESKIGRDLQTQLREYRPQQKQQRPQARQVSSSYQQQRFQSPKSARRRAVSTVERGAKGAGKENTKENAGLGDESWSYVAVNEGSNNGVGGKNVVFANSDNHNRVAAGKKEKDRKIRPPPLEMPPLNHKRSTISALGSPIALSPPMNTSSTKAGIASPVVGELKGWLSNLFNRPSKNPAGNCILYSADDVSKTRRDVLHLLASLGVIVEVSLSEPDSGIERDNSPLRCRVDELTYEGLAPLGMKPVKFRIEFSAIGDEAGSSLSIFPTSPATPLSSGHHLFPAAATSGVRGRSSTLGGGSKSPLLPLSPLPSPNFVAASVMIVIQEKGSSSTFKAIWKKLKEVYDDGCGESMNPYSSFSPVMTSTPLMGYAA
ncbi:Pkinase-domain-containing protein [Gymnopus androsaceus JB14]|uniref:Pkinase-domain-containing protein n=1 Tax=Gymnopus androsaceus JB14 TaxID=1447944 RepID=A0A6A4I3H7_9AGAR|nr:Pkinase-domain-containing protein [Gymnopus androsaceus JB14]